MQIPSADDFAVGDRFVNNLGRVLRITSVVGTGREGMITYEYEPDAFFPETGTHSREASTTIGWVKL